MKQLRDSAFRYLAAGLTGANLVVSLAAPAAAAGGSSPVGSLMMGPATPSIQQIKWPADLVLEDLDVVPQGNVWKVTAMLRNGRVGFAGHTYPGGGKLKIHRTSGGTIPIEHPNPFAAIPDPGVGLGSRSIPALPYGQAITLTVYSSHRGIFTAFTDAGPQVLDAPTPTLPEINPNNNSMTVNNLIPKTVVVNTATLNLALGSLMNQFQARIDDSDSFVKLPGVFQQHFAIPSLSWEVSYPVWVFLGFYIETDTFKYWVNDINSNDVDLAFENGGLSLCVNFETNGSEIKGTMDSWDSAAPDINTPKLRVCVKLPLQYTASTQLFRYHNPQVTVDADWQFNGLGQVANGLIPDINSRVSDTFEGFLNTPAVKEKIEFTLNQAIRSQILKGGRIVSATIQSSQATLKIEAGE